MTSRRPYSVGVPSGKSYGPDAALLCYDPRHRTMLERAALEAPLNGYSLHLRPSELESVAAGLGHFDAAPEDDLVTLAEALRQLPVNDRAPAWELAVRRFGRRKELARAAGEIGMDLVHAQDLLDAYFERIAAVRPPQQPSPQTL